MARRPAMTAAQLRYRAKLLLLLVLASVLAAPAEARTALRRKAPLAKSPHAHAMPAKAAIAQPPVAKGQAHAQAAKPADAAGKPTPTEAEDDASDQAVGPGKAPTPKTSDKTADLRAIWQSAPGKVKAVALIVQADTGAVAFEADAKKVVYPASVAKLFTTAAAVKSLDLDKKPVTEVRLVGKGADAELHVVGAGDPTMNTTDWAKLAQAVKAKGISKIKRLVVDATVFDEKLPKAFDEKQTDAAFRAPIGGVMCEASTVQVSVSPGEVGAPPVVSVVPDAGDAVVVVNQAKTVADKRDALTVLTRAAGKKTEVVVQGTISAKKKAIGSGRRRVADASSFAAGVFARQLQKAGIEIAGEPMLAKSAPGQVIASHSHHDWRAILHVTNKQSHNGYAETLFKQVGLAHGGAPATAEKSADGVKKALQGLEIRWDGVKIANGSGLYHADQVTAQAVVDLLRAMSKDAKASDYKQSLAIGGVDGTLRGRLHGATQGKVQAKTGTLDDVSGLAGYAESASGKRYIFAFFFNEVKAGASPYRGVQDRMLRRLLAD